MLRQKNQFVKNSSHNPLDFRSWGLLGEIRKDIVYEDRIHVGQAKDDQVKKTEPRKTQSRKRKTESGKTKLYI